MRFEWLTMDQIEELVNPVLKQKGWAELNLNPEFPTIRVLGAFLDDGTLIRSLTFQFYPLLGPLVSHDETIRDSGEASRGLAAVMYDWLIEMNARDFMVIANSPVTERLCHRFGMKKTDAPVYLNHPGGNETE